MFTHQLDLRPMSPNDVEKVARLHAESFPDSRSTRLGMPFLVKMYTWFVLKQPRLACVAIMNGQIIGFVTGAIGGSSRKIFRYAWREISLAFVRNPTLIMSSGMFEAWPSYLHGLLPSSKSVVSQSVSSTDKIKAVLTSIAVSPSARGRQAGKALVAAFEQAAQACGASRFGLGVELDNHPARRLYESCGWILAKEDTSTNSANYIKEIGKI